MSHRSTVSPSTLPVDLREEGVVVEYLDGREAFYRGVPEKVTGSVRTRPGVLVQVLVMDPTDTEGVLTYVNDRSTHDEILEDTGVGRVFVEPGEETELFPGVTARAEGHAVVVEADPQTAGGRVFVFAEDELQERSFEVLNESDEDEGDGDEAGGDEAGEDAGVQPDGGVTAGESDEAGSDEAGSDDAGGDADGGDDDGGAGSDDDDADEPGSADGSEVEEGEVDAGRVDDANVVDEGESDRSGGSGDS